MVRSVTVTTKCHEKAILMLQNKARFYHENCQVIQNAKAH